MNRFFGSVTGLTQSPPGLDTGFDSGGTTIASFFGDGSDGTFNPETVLTSGTTAPNGGIVANLYDRSSGTVFQVVTPSSADPVLFQIDFGSPTMIYSVRFWQASNTVATRTVQLQSSTDNVTYTNFANVSVTTSIADVTILPVVGQTIPAARYWRVIASGSATQTFTTQGVTLNFMTGDLQTNTTWRVGFPAGLNGGIVVKQFTSLTVPFGYYLSTGNPCRGLIIYSQGDVTVNGGIDMTQKAGLAPNGMTVPLIITPSVTSTATTSSLLHFDGADGSTVFTDAQGRTWTGAGNARLVTAQLKFGTASLFCDGTGDWITTPAFDDFSYGYDDFTVDYWARFNVVGTNLFMFGARSSATASTGSVEVNKNGSNLITLNYVLAGQTAVSTSGTTAITSGVWYHIAVVRNGSLLTVYLNGNVEVQANIGNAPLQRSQANFTIGADGPYGSGNSMNGWMDEFRVVKGRAMYTAPFTPPVAAYTFVPSFTDITTTEIQYYKLTTIFQNLRGGYGGNGGKGGDNGNAGGIGGIGGAPRQNLGGFGGGGGGGAVSGSNGTGGIGGSIPYAELGGGGGCAHTAVTSTASVVAKVDHGGGGFGGTNQNISKNPFCFGGGGGGNGGSSGRPEQLGNDGDYAGGLVKIIARGNVQVNASGSIRANGGAGGTGGAAADTGNAGGGGGGGSGGGVVAIYYTGTLTNLGTISVNGGLGGAGGTGVGPAGTAGTSGSVGTIFTQQL